MAAPRSVEQIAAKTLLIRSQAAARDRRMGDAASVRRGDLQDVYPDLLPDAWPRPVVANLVDVVARDLSEVIAPLPSLNCSSGVAVSDRAKKFGDKRTKIAHHYSTCSELERQMFNGVDQYLTYGLETFVVEPDFDEKTPKIRVEDPLNGYPEWDRFGKLISYTKIFRKPANVLVAEYPEYEAAILGDKAKWDRAGALNDIIELFRYDDDHTMMLFLPARNNLVLVKEVNKLGKIPIVVAMRPGPDGEPRGQFDDVIWIQIARAKMAMLGMEAAEKSVQAPLALPSDVQEFAFGPDSVIRSQNPQMIRRVGLELPPGAFQEQALLDTEQRVGARYPDGRGGDVQASVITGQGVQALMGTFDTQIKTAQSILTEAFRKVFALCFAMDEAFWPNTSKTIRGESNGTPYEMSYIPSRDIHGDHTIQPSYGMAAGMDPNRALVFLLQLRGDKDISRDTLMRELPIDMNVTEEQSRIDTEEVRDAIKQGVFGLTQAMPEMAAQGQDVSGILGQMATMAMLLQKGTSIEEAAQAAFTPPPAPPQDPNAPPGVPGAGPPGAAGPGSTPGIGPNGQVSGVAPGQAGEGQGGRPALQQLMAGLASSGSPNLSDTVRQSVPVST